MIRSIKVITKDKNIGEVIVQNDKVLSMIFSTPYSEEGSTCLFEHHFKTVLLSQLEELNDKTVMVKHENNKVTLTTNYGTSFTEYFTKNIDWFKDIIQPESFQSLKTVVEGV